MQKERSVYLNETGEWLLFRAMVCEALYKNDFIKPLLGCDPWEFTSALDMSFKETRKLPLEKWHEQIGKDLQEFYESASK